MSGHTVTPLPGASMNEGMVVSLQAEALPSMSINSTSEALASLPTMLSKKLQSTYQDSFPESLSAGTHTVFGSIVSKLSFVNIATCIAAFLCLRFAAILVYRFYFHPLAKVPGPRIAAATRLYEFWYQGVQHTKFPQKIKELHEKYGPIVRISPEEVSLNDSEFNVDFFMHDRKLNKDPWYYYFGFQNALFVLQDKEKHRTRQANLANHFKGGYFQASYPMITREIGDMIGKFEESADGKETLNLSKTYRKAGNEVMRNFLLGDHYDGANADSRDFSKKAETYYHPLFRSAAWIRHFPWMIDWYNRTPNWVFETMMPMAVYKREIETMIRSLIKSHDDNNKPAHNKALLYQMIDHDTSYRELGAAPAIEEFMELLWGGREVLGHALSNVSFHLMTNPSRMARLHAELKSAPFDLSTATYAQLATLPYLWACCKEGMRLQRGGMFRIPRVCSADVQYKQHFLPAGTPISMSPNFFHQDPAIFPEPESYRPERWLASPAEVERLEKFWNPFGNGSRSCGGRPMAFEVIFRGVANIFSRYKIEFEGCDAEYCAKEGMMEVFPQENSTGLRVSVERWDD